MSRVTVKANEESEATKMAERLAQELKDTVGGDWKISVWFNSSWNYCVKLGSISVSENIIQDSIIGASMTYGAYVNNEKGKAGGALSSWSYKENYGRETPKIAVETAMKNAQATVAKMQDVLTDNNNLIKK